MPILDPDNEIDAACETAPALEGFQLHTELRVRLNQLQNARTTGEDKRARAAKIGIIALLLNSEGMYTVHGGKLF